jgi:xanthine dehydrogenase small subunit
LPGKDIESNEPGGEQIMRYPEISFHLNGGQCVVETPPAMPLQQVLRDVLGLTGTKDGCREGECGACTALIDGEAIDSCLVPICQVEGKHIITIEAFAGQPNLQHPLIASFLEHGAVQCGYCSPGFVLAAAGLLTQNPHPTREQIKKALAGNLCRCTGYDKIISAVEDSVDSFYFPELPKQSFHGRFDAEDSIDVYRLQSLAELDTIPNLHSPDVRFLAGGTDLMTQKANRKPHGKIWIDISACSELKGIDLMDNEIRIGAMTTYSKIASDELILKYATALAQAASQVGSDPIARRATIGGNLANASPAADGFPPLAALDACAVLFKDGQTRKVKISELAVKPGKSLLQPGELLIEVRIPISANKKSGFYKGMPRHAQCIAKVSVAVAIEQTEGRISACKVALGAVGPTVIEASEVGKLLLGKQLTKELIKEASKLAVEIARPINDFRSDVQYRLKLIKVGVIRLLSELN